MSVYDPCLALQLYLKLLPLILHASASLTLCSLTARIVHKQHFSLGLSPPTPNLAHFRLFRTWLTGPPALPPEDLAADCIRIVSVSDSSPGPELCQAQVTVDVR